MPMKFLLQFSKAEIISRMECEINQQLEPCLQICDEIIKTSQNWLYKEYGLNKDDTTRYGCVERHFRISPKVYGKMKCDDLHG